MTGPNSHEAFIYVLMLAPGRSARVIPRAKDYFCAFKMPRLEAAGTTSEILADLWCRSHGVSWLRRSLRPLALGDIIWCSNAAYMLVKSANAECTMLPAGLHVTTVNIDLERVVTCKV